MKKIGKYEIVSILGKGAMGIVYKAVDPDIDRKVAIKTIRFDLVTEGSDTEELMQRFMREAQAAGKLSHPNIVTIYDVGREKDMTYIVMQYIEGPSLQRIIASGEKNTTQQVVQLMTQVCSALEYAHKFGIVHRDIKPGNVLIDNEGKPYICDFGVARIETSTLTQSGTAVGTPSYMSPEQVRGKKVDKRSDIFSMGCILYEFLTGKRPFEAESITTVIYKIINEEPPALAEVKKGLPEGFEHIITKALAKDPGERYQSCGQLAADLRDLDRLAEKTIAITTTEAEPPPVEERKKRRLVPIMAISLSAILVIAAAGAFYLYKKTGNIPFLLSGTQETKGEKATSTSLTEAAVPGSIEDKLTLAKEGTETEKSQLLSKPEAGTLDPINEELMRVEQSFDWGDYDETVKLAGEVLAVIPGNSRARYYLNKANDKINEAARIAETLNTGKTYYNNKSYEQCKQEMKKILDVDKEHKEATRYWNLADKAIYEAGAEKKIKQVIERQRKAEEGREPLALLSDIGSSALSKQRQAYAKLLINNYDEIKWSKVSNISVEFKDRKNAEVSFTYMSTAVYKKTGLKKTIFSGTKTWTMEKQGNTWKIIDEK